MSPCFWSPSRARRIASARAGSTGSPRCAMVRSCRSYNVQARSTFPPARFNRCSRSACSCGSDVLYLASTLLCAFALSPWRAVASVGPLRSWPARASCLRARDNCLSAASSAVSSCLARFNNSCGLVWSTSPVNMSGVARSICPAILAYRSRRENNALALRVPRTFSSYRSASTNGSRAPANISPWPIYSSNVFTLPSATSCRKRAYSFNASPKEGVRSSCGFVLATASKRPDACVTPSRVRFNPSASAFSKTCCTTARPASLFRNTRASMARFTRASISGENVPSEFNNPSECVS